MIDNREYFPCPVCSTMLPVGSTKNGKPYLTCNDCGVQLFIRGKDGIKVFKKLVGSTGPERDAKELILLVDYLDALHNRLEDVQSKKSFLFNDPDLELQEQLIEKQIAKLRQAMKNHDSQ